MVSVCLPSPPPLSRSLSIPPSLSSLGPVTLRGVRATCRTRDAEIRAAVEELWAKEQDLRQLSALLQRAHEAQRLSDAAQMVLLPAYTACGC